MLLFLLLSCAFGSFRWHHPPALVLHRSLRQLVFTVQKEENSFITWRPAVLR